MKLNTLRCDVFSLNKLEDHPLLETSHNTSVSQTWTAAVILWDVFHVSFSPLPKAPWTCVFPALTCSASRFVIFRWHGRCKLCGDKNAHGRQFFEFFGFGTMLITSKCWWFSPKMPGRFWGYCICFRWPWKCLIHVSSILNHVEVFLAQMGEFIHSEVFYILTHKT